MQKNKLPLKEISIESLFWNKESIIYEIPIYQRNYAWEKDEILTLIQDVYDSFTKQSDSVYFIGTLVSYYKGDNVYEIIDGQQRLTTIRLILSAMNLVPANKLTYRARKKAENTIKALPYLDIDEKDIGIENGYKYAKSSVSEIVPADELESFKNYFKSSVHIIHYHVPNDIDLNQYFEVMNSRGEQLEKHEIIKANLMQSLETQKEKYVFNSIWESCSCMGKYIQRSFNLCSTASLFGNNFHDFIPQDFDEILSLIPDEVKEIQKGSRETIRQIIDNKLNYSNGSGLDLSNDNQDGFQPITDFSNFLLVVLKITRLSEEGFNPNKFNLDDKELISEFRKIKVDSRFVKQYAFNLLKIKYLLDNYIVHHSDEEDYMDRNPWNLQYISKDEDKAKGNPKNICEDRSIQDKLVHLLSMFEVSFGARQRKNYLFYCLAYLYEQKEIDSIKYSLFVESLANKYFQMVYLNPECLNTINTPIPGSFDEVILVDNNIDVECSVFHDENDFYDIYGDGVTVSKGIPLFIFNYLDYKIWNLYNETLRGEKKKENSSERIAFFKELGCSDFKLDLFDQFYFSRTRRSLEHFYPQAQAINVEDHLDQNQINCLGNYAMIGNDMNSSGSNWSPKVKLDHYLDTASGKIKKVSVASLKFMIMMQVCKDNQQWLFDEITNHQEKMVKISMIHYDS